MNAENYCERIVLLIEGGLSERPLLTLMQDNALPHTASWTSQRLRENNITPTFWPAYSPDLNPIEAVWNIMKNFIQYKHPDLGSGKVRSLDELRVIVREA